MTAKELDAVGRLSDKADNFSMAAKLPLTPKTHVECLSKGMEEIRDELRKLYIASCRENPWKDQP